MSSQIDQILQDVHIAAIRSEFSQEEMGVILKETLPTIYERSRPLIEAIAEIAQGALPPPVPEPRPALTVTDRERVILALLASRGGGYTLAIHVYLALILEITPAEIANILLLTGIYTGINIFTNCIFELEKTLDLLRNRVDQGEPLDPGAINAALRAAFPVL